MQITLEQVEILKEKAGLSYKEALELLEKTGGDLLKALASLDEDGKDSFVSDDNKEKIWRKVMKKGKEMKIKVNRPGGTIFRVPLVLGVIGAVAFPRVASWSMLALLLTRCSLEIDFH
ncbi:MAG: DUF4342 domain-containing protein [Dethiobacter sp.]|jgi:hypothetical protein|nr:MAG: DUF4342 domain-containing protein [Dethiobacter sp.]